MILLVLVCFLWIWLVFALIDGVCLVWDLTDIVLFDLFLVWFNVWFGLILSCLRFGLDFIAHGYLLWFSLLFTLWFVICLLELTLCFFDWLDLFSGCLIVVVGFVLYGVCFLLLECSLVYVLWFLCVWIFCLVCWYLFMPFILVTLLKCLCGDVVAIVCCFESFDCFCIFGCCFAINWFVFCLVNVCITCRLFYFGFGWYELVVF